MIRLVPKWAYHYDEFWIAIKNRNFWFIKLRYYFVGLLILFYLAGEFIFNFRLSISQEYAFIITATSILLYNLLIHKYRDSVKAIPGKFNHMHLSLLQMILDLTALMILVYYTGTIESPIYMFFIFQMVIGSLILQGHIVYTVGIFIIIIYTILIALQYFGLITTHYLTGLYESFEERTLSYIFVFIIMFSSMMLISIFLANTIAIKLYERERQLWETLEKLNNAEKAKQKYIIGVVHEIKTPIAAVQSILDIIINKFIGPVSEEVMDKLTRARIRSSEAITLINNVLHISKIRLFDEKSTEKLDIPALFKNLIEKHIDLANSKNIRLLFNDSQKNNRIIIGDNLLFELAFSNLLNNAIKYNLTNGFVMINISDDNDNIIILIEDDGIGIPTDEREKIFLQFFRASNIKGQNIDGSGLGLSLVNEVVLRYNGKIDVLSPSSIGRENRPGTTFKIILRYPSENLKQ